MISNFEEFLNEKRKTKNSPDWHDSDAPDAKGKFRDLGIRALAAWLIKTRKGDMRRITGSLNQQIVFNRNEDPAYAKKMEKVREEVKRQLKKNEDFAAVGVAPEGNVSGMGPVVPPTATSVGSGDAWPSLGQPSSLIKLKKKRKTKKRTKKFEAFVLESENGFKVLHSITPPWDDPLDFNYHLHLICSAYRDLEEGAYSNDWIRDFSNAYEAGTPLGNIITYANLRNLQRHYKSGLYVWAVAKSEDRNEAEKKAEELGYEIFQTSICYPSDYYILYRLMSEKERAEQSKKLTELLKMHREGMQEWEVKAILDIIPSDSGFVRGLKSGLL
jgi:hypothetical protein